MSDFKQLASLKSQKKIDSPLAKYNSIGQLSCIVCNQVVKSELMWNAHLNSKLHLDNKNKMKMKLVGEMAKPLSTSVNTTNVASKRKSTPANVTETIKEDKSGIKKQKIDNLVKTTNSIDLNKINAEFDNNYKIEPKKIEVETQPESSNENQSENARVMLAMGGTDLPEGFFDDPEMDAKARGQSRSDNLEAEFEEFKKIIQTEEVKSEVIIEKDDLMSNVDRDIEEVDELISRWTKIENLHNRREELRMRSKKAAEEKIEIDQASDSDEDEDLDLENVLSFNLRSKNRF